VLITPRPEGGKLKGFSYSTLERIAVRPACSSGLASVSEPPSADSVLKAIMSDQLPRAVLAFLTKTFCGHPFLDASGSSVQGADRHRSPSRPHATGEERAWGRRLAKRFGIENGQYDDRKFIAEGDGSFPCVLDHEA